ncbi:hypothetical protein KIN20_015858, partial [Parelaphostrongylus tenuis]
IANTSTDEPCEAHHGHALAVAFFRTALFLDKIHAHDDSSKELIDNWQQADCARIAHAVKVSFLEQQYRLAVFH